MENPTLGLRNLFINELKQMYWAERAHISTLSKMIRKANADELMESLEWHLEVTQEHVTRLEEIFALIGEKAQGTKCETMLGLIKEAEEVLSMTHKGMVRDAAIITAGMKIEHYEMACYGVLCSLARTLDEQDAAFLLEETLSEERYIDNKLSEISEAYLNSEALDYYKAS